MCAWSRVHTSLIKLLSPLTTEYWILHTEYWILNTTQDERRFGLGEVRPTPRSSRRLEIQKRDGRVSGAHLLHNLIVSVLVDRRASSWHANYTYTTVQHKASMTLLPTTLSLPAPFVNKDWTTIKAINSLHSISASFNHCKCWANRSTSNDNITAAAHTE